MMLIDSEAAKMVKNWGSQNNEMATVERCRFRAVVTLKKRVPRGESEDNNRGMITTEMWSL
jgi:hypothetical protein